MALPSTDAALAAFLADRDLPCPACGYNLRGLTSGHCPECRQHLVLSVSLAEPPVVQYALAVVGLSACGAAFGTLLLFVITLVMLNNGTPRGEEAVIFLWSPASILAVDAVAVALFLRPASRRWFRTRSRLIRWLTVLACWAISLAIPAAWLAVFFAMM